MLLFLQRVPVLLLLVVVVSSPVVIPLTTTAVVEAFENHPFHQTQVAAARHRYYHHDDASPSSPIRWWRLWPGTAVRNWKRSVSLSSSSQLSMSSKDDDERYDDEARRHARSMALNDARTDIRNFLTQRSIQSFMFLLEQCRDPHSGKWIEDFLETSNQLEYHGTGAGYFFNEKFGNDYQWDGPLKLMIQQPKDVVIVSAKRRGRGHGGWSKHNPYLEERFVEFEIDIDPVSLVSRILSVREQLANEWVSDLDVLDQANKQIINSYFTKVKKERDDNKNPDGSGGVTIPSVAFERTAVNILNNFTSYAGAATESSPFRAGSFDLLYNLCTQESIHRLLREHAKSRSTSGSNNDNNNNHDESALFEWLKDFYVDRVEDYFDGDLPYGRADDFIEELLLTSPRIIDDERDDKIKKAAVVIDPFGLAEQIILTRSIVVQEWKDRMSDVPNDHAEIRKLLLEKQMDAWGSSKSSSSSSEGFQ